MANNTLPIALKNARIQRGDATLTSANTATDGTGTTVLAFTAHATNDSICHYLILKPAANAAATSLTTLRIFVNNGADPTTATNNMFIKSFSLPVTTESATLGSNDQIIPLNLPLPAGYRIYCAIVTASANGWYVTGVGGDC